MDAHPHPFNIPVAAAPLLPHVPLRAVSMSCDPSGIDAPPPCVGLFKILFYFEAYVHESMIFFANTTFVLGTPLPPFIALTTENSVCSRLTFISICLPYNIVYDNIL